MNHRTAGILATSITAVLCGCTGFIILCAGILTAFSSFYPGAEIDLSTGNNPRAALTFGLGALCLGAVLIAIPFIVGIFSLWNQPEMVEVPNSGPTEKEMSGGTLPDEPIPPAS